MTRIGEDYKYTGSAQQTSTSLLLEVSVPSVYYPMMKFMSYMALVLTYALLVLMLLQGSHAQDSYSCSGSTLCRDLSQGDCDAARRQIQPGNRYFTGGSSGSTGVCSGHCGLFVSGSNCDLTGSEMITAFDELRARNCAKCGVKTYNDGCKFKADYVTGC